MTKNYGNDENSALALSFFDTLINDNKSICLKDVFLKVRFYKYIVVLNLETNV